MSIFDGTDAPATLGQTLVEMCKKTPWGDERHQDEAIAVFALAFPDDVTKTGPAPQTGVTDPLVSQLSSQAITLAKNAQENAELRAQLAEAQLREARAQLVAIHAGVSVADAGVDTAALVEDDEKAGPVDVAAASKRSRGETVPAGDGAVNTADDHHKGKK